MKTIKATLYKTDGSQEPLEIDPKKSLETLQALVGGLIQIIPIIPLKEQRMGILTNAKDLVINEEGRLLELPPNPFSFLVSRGSIWEIDTFMGDIVLIDGRLK
jgi:hypothetical protein